MKSETFNLMTVITWSNFVNLMTESIHIISVIS